MLQTGNQASMRTKCLPLKKGLGRFSCHRLNLAEIYASGSSYRIMPAFPQSPDSAGTGFHSIALTDPHEQRRKAVAAALVDCQGGPGGNNHASAVTGVMIREFSSYPSDLQTLPQMLEQQFDVVIVELDTDPEYALSLVGSIGAQGAAIVMVYSALTDVELVVRSMRAGAREFLTLPLSPASVAEALTRASVRRP